MQPAVIAELCRLGLTGHRCVLDQIAIADAMLEAFGDESWTQLPDGTLVDRLRAAVSPKGLRAEHRPRYAALTFRGVLEYVVAIGSETEPYEQRHGRSAMQRPSTLEKLESLADSLRRRGYVDGYNAAARHLSRLGRLPRDDGCSRYFSRADGLVLSPLAAQPRPIAVVIRLTGNIDGVQGAQAAANLIDGLRHAGICFYSRHTRFGLVRISIRPFQLPWHRAACSHRTQCSWRGLRPEIDAGEVRRSKPFSMAGSRPAEFEFNDRTAAGSSLGIEMLLQDRCARD